MSAHAPAQLDFPGQRRWLGHLHRRYHHHRFIAPDPLQFLGRWPDVRDREVGGLVAAILALGNVTAINRSIDRALARIGPRPGRWLIDRTPAQIDRALAGFKHRWITGERLAAVLIGCRRLIEQHGRLDASFPVDPDQPTILPAIDEWVRRITAAAGRPTDRALPRAGSISACKRLCLYLRWMVRADRIDPGGWRFVDRAKLVVPLDTHIACIGRRLGWTDRRTPGRAMALQITAALRRFDAADPLRFDFALTRPGIRREPWPVDPAAISR
jgi:uncharacterized protein (TIGR02757 family)